VTIHPGWSRCPSRFLCHDSISKNGDLPSKWRVFPIPTFSKSYSDIRTPAGILLSHQDSLHPTVNMLTALARKPHFPLASTNRPIASKLNFSASCTLTFNCGMPHLVLEGSNI
jgi:hypothetical protein